MNFPNHKTNETWRLLGSDNNYDYYVVNEASGKDSLTGVFGSELNLVKDVYVNR